jgi:hypothetical protein
MPINTKCFINFDSHLSFFTDLNTHLEENYKSTSTDGNHVKGKRSRGDSVSKRELKVGQEKEEEVEAANLAAKKENEEQQQQ